MFFFLSKWGINRNAEQTNVLRSLHGSRDLFVMCSDSFPMNSEKDTQSLKHKYFFIKTLILFIFRTLKIKKKRGIFDGFYWVLIC